MTDKVVGFTIFWVSSCVCKVIRLCWRLSPIRVGQQEHRIETIFCTASLRDGR